MPERLRHCSDWLIWGPSHGHLYAKNFDDFDTAEKFLRRALALGRYQSSAFHSLPTFFIVTIRLYPMWNGRSKVTVRRNRVAPASRRVVGRGERTG
jgi:hypothetical protein